MTIRDLENRVETLENESPATEPWTIAEILSEEDWGKYERLPDGRYRNKRTGVLRPSMKPLSEIISENEA